MAADSDPVSDTDGGMPDDVATARLRSRLAEVEARITAQRRLVDGIVASVRGENVDDEHDPEGATLAWERQQAVALAAEAATERDELLAALDRVAAGTYGVCEVCGRPIPAGRLEVRPAATRCVEHAR
ncbi:TraR/DksA family transcriptional regulator [Isoptericola sp. CG 20/1183]|uniref:TraR/DksA family transcriptional regulator n=1 Tax=Isoptericola halotolerans TaxID=300560 RepID=A0ABX5EKJ8_9MICO|nr:MULTISPECIES: TraR/DksA C4-type zinc finger protein [Isoptericola]PRZ04141.1 TraR/DksA family transcriptional regulator [Isoptericola sp. CG 20/1183]PRZ10034.1 TraR/DksA family transcriptional regulator [Isoptericola halotolerans]